MEGPGSDQSTLRLVSSRDSVNTILQGYHAFVAGDLGTIAELLDPEIEWFSVAPEQPPADLDEVQTILSARQADGYRIELERCVGKGEDVLVAFRAAGVEKDPDDDRPLQSRRTFTIGRYWAIVTVREGRVVRVRDFPGLRPGLEALGLDEQEI
jgi:ketosteroid isomerase-like protein